MALLAGGIAVQLPQIAKILRNKSTAGLSESAWVLQSFSTGMYVAFNFIKGYDFMLWGDSMFAGQKNPSSPTYPTSNGIYPDCISDLVLWPFTDSINF